MTFDAMLTQVLDLLQRQGRVSYRALKRRFDLDDAYLEDLKVEIIKAQRLAIDEAGEVLVWAGAAPPQTQGPQPLDTPATQAVPISPLTTGREAPEAERRQLTVLFCDLVDSTALAARLDPEELREVVRAYQTVCAGVIGRFEGHIAQYLGDGLLVYFGYPLAHEDDALRAGLGMLEALEQLNTRLTRECGIRLSVRLGIHTGLVVVGEMGAGTRYEQLALGETPNLAARLQGLATPDTIVISTNTYRLVQGFFACHDLDSQTLKGSPTPVRVYRVLTESGTQSRLETVGSGGLTPLVGREPEVALLQERWTQSKDGLGQVVLLSGEAGIGKSRLVQVLKAHIEGEPHTRLECRCSSYYQNSALYPVIDLFQRALQLHRDDTPQQKLSKLEGALEQYGFSLPGVVPLFASLLSLPLPDRYPALTLTPQRQRQKTLEAVLAVLLALAARQPLLFIVEDLHWVDPSTLELLSLLLDQGPTARMLTLLTCRPEFRPPWGFRAHLTPITLNRLPRTQVAVMVERVVGGKALPAEVHQQVVARTDGVPLFVEELTRMVLESGLLREREDHYELTGPLPPLAIPTTLHDSLMARLDRLAAVKDVAQLGATLGRTFSYELLRAVTPLDDAALQQALAQLVAAELLYQRGAPPQATYLFKHALIQEAAYQSLLKSTRQQSHKRIAQVLETQFPEILEAQPELLAYHYTKAGLNAQAVAYWQQAGQRALQRSAHVEAMSHLTRGLEILAALPDTVERTQHELSLQITLGSTLMALKGQGAAEVGQAYARARELCRQVGETPQLFPVLFGLWRFYLVRAEYQTARELAEQCFSLAQQVQAPALLLEAHFALGVSLLWHGEVVPARAHLEQGIALYNPQEHRALAFRAGIDLAVWCLSHAAQALWMLGYPAQALRQSHKALTLAQELSHPPSLAAVLHYAALIHCFCREVHATQERAEAAMALASEQGLPQWLTLGAIYRAWALAEQGQLEEGIAQIRQALAAWRAMGAGLGIVSMLAMLGEVYGKAGQAEEGLRLLDVHFVNTVSVPSPGSAGLQPGSRSHAGAWRSQEKPWRTGELAVYLRNRHLAEALAHVASTGERSYAAQVYRLKGELLLRQAIPDEAQAETCFHQALDLARHQQARSLELRTAVSLARLWQRQGKGAEAQQRLAEVYNWFTEGFDTADLQEAKALLEELS